MTELSAAEAPSELGTGVLVGLGMVCAIVGTLWLLGYYRITGVNAWTVAFVLLANDGASGIEGSALALLACLVVGAYLLSRVRRKGRFVGPVWTQRHAPRD